MAEHAPSTAAPAVQARPQARFRLSTFTSLRFRDYRFMWFAQIGRTAAMWMEQIARPVLILQLTDSALLVGLVVAVRMVPQLLFGLIAGVVADRFDRKRVMLAAQATTTSTHVILAALVFTGLVEPWHVFVLAFVTGSSLVFNQTSRNALIPQLVPQEQVLNAVSLNTMALNMMRVVGPAIAGVLLLSGVGSVYLLAAFLGMWGFGWTVAIGVKHEPQPPEERRSWFEDLGSGLRYMMQNPPLIAVLGPPLIMFMFGLPYISVFVPLFAKDVLDLGDSGVGALVAVAGSGALLGSLFMASQTSLPRRGLLMLLFIALFSTSLLLFSRSTLLPVSIVTLMAASAMSTSYMALTNSLLLELSPSDMRGRVMSLMSLDRGLVPAGAALAGGLAASLGPQDGLMVMSGICLSLAVLAAVFARPLRRI